MHRGRVAVHFVTGVGGLRIAPLLFAAVRHVVVNIRTYLVGMPMHIVIIFIASNRMIFIFLQYFLQYRRILDEVVETIGGRLVGLLYLLPSSRVRRQCGHETKPDLVKVGVYPDEPAVVGWILFEDVQCGLERSRTE